MKAIVIEEPGDVDVMKYVDVPDPKVAARDVLIEIDSCGVCFHDIVTRNGVLKRGIEMPLIPGHEISGTVSEVGSEVRDFRPGDRVATVQRFHVCGCCAQCRTGHETLCSDQKFLGDVGLVGGYAEYVCVEHDNVAKVPPEVPLEQAAITACAFGTVFNAMREVGNVKAGETVLVTGSGGGLGMHAVQFARVQGAFVIAQTTSRGKVSQLQNLGAHEVVLHERGEDFSDQVRSITQGVGVNVVVDNVGSILFEPIRRSLAVGGRWILIGQLGGDFVPFNPAQLFFKRISMLSATSTTRLQLEQCLEIVSRGQVTPVVSKILPLSQAREAHSLVEKAKVAGRIVLKPQAD